MLKNSPQSDLQRLFRFFATDIGGDIVSGYPILFLSIDDAFGVAGASVTFSQPHSFRIWQKALFRMFIDLFDKHLINPTIPGVLNDLLDKKNY